MQSEIVTIDRNAHINQVHVQIIIKPNSTIARISFKNSSVGTIIAEKFIAAGFDSFNNLVRINNQQIFYITIQDLCIEPNNDSGVIDFALPDSNIRKINISEYQTSYIDGTVTTYKGKSISKYTRQSYDEGSVELAAIRVTLPLARYQYQVNDDETWFCTCGQLNNSNSNVCQCCKRTKKESEYFCSSEGLKRSTEYLNAKIAKNNEQMQIIEKKKTAKKTTKAILTAIIVIIVAGLLYFFRYRRFLNQNQMANSIANSGYIWRKDPFEGFVCTSTVVLYSDSNTPAGDIGTKIEITSFNPYGGYFIANGERYYILFNGNIRFRSHEYKKVSISDFSYQSIF